MPSHSPAAIANAFVDIAGRALPQMTLHKLTYFAHGWNLAVFDEPLVSDSPEAWDNGPVFRVIWDRIRDYGVDNRGHVLDPSNTPYSEDLTRNEKAILEHVWKKYGKYGPYALSDMTHQPGTPWSDVYFSKGRNAKIEDQAIKEHYKQLALAGRG